MATSTAVSALLWFRFQSKLETRGKENITGICLQQPAMQIIGAAFHWGSRAWTLVQNGVRELCW